MKLNLKIYIPCGKKVCNPSVNNKCRFVRESVARHPYCILFMEGLLGRRVLGKNCSYEQYRAKNAISTASVRMLYAASMSAKTAKT